MNKAWRIDVVGFNSCLCAARTRGLAVGTAYRSLRELGYGISWTDITARRDRRYDEWAARQTKLRCISEEYAK